MTKIVKNICIDAETWAKAMQKTDSVSGTINFLLKRWVETEADNYERNKLETMKLQMQENQAKMAALQKELAEIKEKESKKRVVRVIQ